MHKLAAAAGEGGVITRELVQACTTESPEYKIYRFLEGIMSNRPGEGLEGLWHMLEEGTHPLAALSMIEGQIKAIAFADWIRDSAGNRKKRRGAGRPGFRAPERPVQKEADHPVPRELPPSAGKRTRILKRETGDREAVDVLLHRSPYRGRMRKLWESREADEIGGFVFVFGALTTLLNWGPSGR